MLTAAGEALFAGGNTAHPLQSFDALPGSLTGYQNDGIRTDLLFHLPGGRVALVAKRRNMQAAERVETSRCPSAYRDLRLSRRRIRSPSSPPPSMHAAKYPHHTGSPASNTDRASAHTATPNTHIAASTPAVHRSPLMPPHYPRDGP
ncbi:hypothetical protein [Streptomyces sp. NPDC055189]